MEKQPLLQLSIPLELAFDVSNFYCLETLSIPYKFTVNITSQAKLSQLKPLLSKPVCLTITLKTSINAKRHFYGWVKSIKNISKPQQLEQQYEIVCVSNLFDLNQAKKRRIFKNQSAIDILKTVLAEHKINNYDLSGIKKPLTSLNYYTQYDETDLRFFQRLLATHGLFYYFKHMANTVILCVTDTMQCLPQVDYALPMTNQTKIKSLNISDFCARHYDYAHPEHIKEVEAGQGFNQDYYYPSQGLEQQQAAYVNWRQQYQTAQTNCPDLTAGQRLQDKIWLYQVEHKAENNSQSRHYKNKIIYYAIKQPLIPKIIAKPLVSSMHYAIVNENTDDLTNVKVTLYWDKQQQQTLFLRLKSQWAGENWGFQFIPRINQQVLVDFENNDVDYPVIVGQLYDNQHPEPFSLPSASFSSGFKSRTLNSTDINSGHSLVFSDIKSQETLKIKSEKSQQITANHHHLVNIGHDCENTIKKGDRTLSVKHQHEHHNHKKIVLATAKSSLAIEPTRIKMTGFSININ